MAGEQGQEKAQDAARQIIVDDPEAPTIEGPPPVEPTYPPERIRLLHAAFDMGRTLAMMRPDFLLALVRGEAPWWNELAPLTRFERANVIVQLEAAARKAAAAAQKKEDAP